MSGTSANWPKWLAAIAVLFGLPCHSRGKVTWHLVPLSVMAAHPWGYRGLMDKINGSLHSLLLEVNSWGREALMDAAVAAGYYRDGGTAELAYRALQKETESRVEIWSYAWVPQSVADFQRDFVLVRQLGARQILFWEADYIDDRAQAADLKAAMAGHACW